VLTGAASAKSYSLVQADVAVQMAKNGALLVDEHIEYVFDGPFSGGYREIPTRPGESVSRVSVLENGHRYRPGGCTELGCSDTPDTFGVARLDGKTRIVWHYSALDETRTFEIRYTMSHLAVAYDDVVDVNLNVWGDEWKVGLPRLTSALNAPGRVLRAWGNPVWVRGQVTLEGEAVHLTAIAIPDHQLVELRALVPRRAFTSTSGMKVVHGKGLGAIVGAEKADAAAAQRDHAKVEKAIHHPLRYLLYVLALGVIPALLVILLVYLLFGREPRTGYDREYEQEPPTDTKAALVPALLRQGGDAGSFEFTATLFDLIRRGVYTSKPVTTERKIWGGLRHEQVADLELSAGKDDGLTPWEQNVASVVNGVLNGGAERLSSFRDRIESQRTTMAPRFRSFKSNIGKDVASRRWFRSGGIVPLALAVLLFLVGAFVAFGIAANRWRPTYVRWHDVILLGLGAAAVIDVVVLVVALGHRRLWKKCTPAAAAEAERWEAFRRYLTDFPRLDEAPPATLALWESYLVYGIAFGIADRVLQAAHLSMPEQLAQASSIYWISPNGDLGSGATSMGIGDLASGFGSALAPPSSGSGGGGGGGGGGGAW
jgi:uncharacterized membrane protein